MKRRAKTTRAGHPAIAGLGLALIVAGLAVLLGPWRLAWPAWRPVFKQPFTVVLDPGHGGADPGAIGLAGLREKDVTLAIALHARDALRKAGFRVALTRDDDRTLSLAGRVAFASGYRNSVFVSIHLNHSPRSVTRGVEVFFSSHQTAPPQPSWWEGLRPQEPAPDRGGSESLAASVLLELTAALATPDRGVKDRDFYVIRNIGVPAVLVEAGFLSNPMDAALFADDGYRRRAGEGVARGVAHWLRPP